MQRLIIILYVICLSISDNMISAQMTTPEVASDWIKSRKWDNGWSVSPDASVNEIEFANQYRRNPDLWDSMFAFLAGNDLENMKPGKYDIVPGRCWATISEYVPKTEDQVKIESHKKFIDLQYVVKGSEKMGLANNVTPRIEYIPEREVAFWYSDDVSYHHAGPGSFFLFFPSDYHQPSVRERDEPITNRKVVVKIEYAD